MNYKDVVKSEAKNLHFTQKPNKRSKPPTLQ